jgi:hypothetical protein
LQHFLSLLPRHQGNSGSDVRQNGKKSKNAFYYAHAMMTSMKLEFAL